MDDLHARAYARTGMRGAGSAGRRSAPQRALAQPRQAAGRGSRAPRTAHCHVCAGVDGLAISPRPVPGSPVSMTPAGDAAAALTA